MQQGIRPFALVFLCMLAGLLIAVAGSIKGDSRRMVGMARFGNAVAIAGFLCGFQLRASEWLYGESHFGRSDSLPGPGSVIVLFTIYIALRVLCTSYIWYRRDRQDRQRATRFLKDAGASLFLIAAVLGAALLIEFVSG